MWQTLELSKILVAVCCSWSVRSNSSISSRISQCLQRDLRRRRPQSLLRMILRLRLPKYFGREGHFSGNRGFPRNDMKNCNTTCDSRRWKARSWYEAPCESWDGLPLRWYAKMRRQLQGSKLFLLNAGYLADLDKESLGVAMSYSHFGLKGGILLPSRLLVLRCSFKTWLWFVLMLLFPSYCCYCSCFHLFLLLLGAYQNDGGWWWLVRWSWVFGNGFFNSSCWGTMCKVPYSVMKASWFGCILCSCMGRFPVGFAVGRWDLELNGVSQDPRWDQRSGYLEDLRPRDSKVNAGLKQSLWQHVRVFRYISL